MTAFPHLARCQITVKGGALTMTSRVNRESHQYSNIEQGAA